MPRASRHFVAGQIWHITHRCHQQHFLLKFSTERRRWLYWLFQARKRYGFTILNYIVTSNHIHLLVQDQGNGEIAPSMQLIAGRTAQEFNRRKKRRGVFWEDRYHSTAVESGAHLSKCMVYIDLNMVRAGIVSHPSEWPECGYNEILSPRRRAGRLDFNALQSVFEATDRQQLQQWRRECVAAQLAVGRLEREPIWSGSVAVGSFKFTTSIQTSLGFSNRGRRVRSIGQCYILR